MTQRRKANPEALGVHATEHAETPYCDTAPVCESMTRRMQPNKGWPRDFTHGVEHDETPACTGGGAPPDCVPVSSAVRTMEFGTYRELRDALDRIELEGADVTGAHAIRKVYRRTTGGERIVYADGSVLLFKIRRRVVDAVALCRSHDEREQHARDANTPYNATGSGSYDPPPAHYDANGIDPWAVWDAFDLDRYTANAVKYLLRAGRKDIAPRLDDLKKARNYINKAIEREEGK